MTNQKQMFVHKQVQEEICAWADKSFESNHQCPRIVPDHRIEHLLQH